MICDSLSSIGHFRSKVLLGGAAVIWRPNWPETSRMAHSHGWQLAIQLEAVDLSIKDLLHMTSAHGLGFSQHGDWDPRGSTATMQKLQPWKSKSFPFPTFWWIRASPRTTPDSREGETDCTSQQEDEEKIWGHLVIVIRVLGAGWRGGSDGDHYLRLSLAKEF